MRERWRCPRVVFCGRLFDCLGHHRPALFRGSGSQRRGKGFNQCHGTRPGLVSAKKVGGTLGVCGSGHLLRRLWAAGQHLANEPLARGPQRGPVSHVSPVLFSRALCCKIPQSILRKKKFTLLLPSLLLPLFFCCFSLCSCIPFFFCCLPIFSLLPSPTTLLLSPSFCCPLLLFCCVHL